MRTLKTFLLAALAIAIAFGLFPSPAQAQGFNVNGLYVQPFKAVTVAGSVTAVHTVPAIWVRYAGTSAGTATVAIAAGGDVTFQVAGANDTTVNPASGAFAAACGATPGVLDLSTPAATCDTLGEVVDVINSSPNWVAWLDAALRADTSDNALKDFVAASAKTAIGIPLYQETTTGLTATVNLSADETKGVRNASPGEYGKLPNSPFADINTTLLYASENITTTDNAANLQKVYCVIENYQPKGKSSSETATLLFQKAVASTGTVGTVNEFVNAGGLTCSGGKLLYRVNGNTTLTAPSIVVTGVRQVKPN